MVRTTQTRIEGESPLPLPFYRVNPSTSTSTGHSRSAFLRVTLAIERERMGRQDVDGTEALLSLDLEEDDILYRIRRGERIVYVSVPPSIFPSVDPINRTEESSVLARLRTLPEWNRWWKTLLVLEKQGRLTCRLDAFEPHGLSEILISAPHYSLLDLQRVSRVSDRVSVVSYKNAVYVLKIARFKYELNALKREIQAHHVLRAFGVAIAPRFIGYVYEEAEDRIIGFLMEYLSGRPAQAEDLDICKEAVRSMHGMGISHGDVNKFNILIVGNRAKLVDFEAAVFQGEDAFTESKDIDLTSLAIKLKDTSGLGRH